MHENMKDYSKALEFYQKTLAIQEKYLPENHPDLATTYSNIASVYNIMKDYSKALEFYQKSLSITKYLTLQMIQNWLPITGISIPCLSV